MFMEYPGREGVAKDFIDALDSLELEEDQATSDDTKEDEPIRVDSGPEDASP